MYSRAGSAVGFIDCLRSVRDVTGPIVNGNFRLSRLSTTQGSRSNFAHWAVQIDLSSQGELVDLCLQLPGELPEDAPRLVAGLCAAADVAGDLGDSGGCLDHAAVHLDGVGGLLFDGC